MSPRFNHHLKLDSAICTLYYRCCLISDTSKGSDVLSLDTVILGLLGESESSGYDLAARLAADPIAELWSADQAQIYRTLQRLRSAGLVTSRRVRQTDRPDRIIYRPTEEGAASLAEKLVASAPMPPVRDPFLAQLYFSAELEDAQLLTALHARRDEYAARLESVHSKSARLDEQGEATARALVLRHTTLDGLAVQLRALIDWLEACIQAVEAGALPHSEIADHNI